MTGCMVLTSDFIEALFDALAVTAIAAAVAAAPSIAFRYASRLGRGEAMASATTLVLGHARGFGVLFLSAFPSSSLFPTDI